MVILTSVSLDTVVAAVEGRAATAQRSWLFDDVLYIQWVVYKVRQARLGIMKGRVNHVTNIRC